MKKITLVLLAGLTLFLAGCIQQTPTQNQNLNQPAVNQPMANQNQNLNVNQPAANLNGCKDGSCVGEYKISNFFNDLFSKEILAGESTYDMSSFKLFCGPGGTAKTNEYGFKIINAIKQLGYFFMVPCGEKLNIHNENNIGMILLNAYQRDNGLPESKYVDKILLQKMDAQIGASEKRDDLFATNFVCYNTIKDAPPNEPSKNHRAFLLNSALNVFPEKLRIPKEECANGQLAGMTSCDEGSTSGKYWLGYNQNCNLKTISILNLPYDDYGLTKTMIHEYSHLIDQNAYCTQSFRWCVDTTEFYNISFDVNDKISLTWDFYKLRFNMADKEEVKRNFFSYAEGWEDPNYPNYRTAYEDFAVSVGMYVTNGIIFRDYMKDKSPLQKKYNWIKEKIFNGKEFNTGDKNYASYIPNLTTDGLSGTGVVECSGITELNPNYKWDYSFKQ